MILSNFIKALTKSLNTTGTKTTYGTSKFYYLDSANIPSICHFWQYNNNNISGSTLSLLYIGIALSSDTSVPTVDDYRFTNFYKSYDLTSVNCYLDKGPMQTVLTQIVRNDGTGNIVINSVGVFGKYNTTNNETVLLTKTLLDTPVTVAPGEVKTITVTIDYNSFVENVNA